ncbi:sulfotransferase family 2 domain-containing protein [Mameliella sp.]|uniref:sulfotransferase family 2 domain-containing protein n=1 Tax=Mameliella sp. TaxID=1924940 RepID=UPI003BA8CBC6
MPIFHHQKLIFVHIPKNAGKSVESAFLGPGGPVSGKRSSLNAACKLLLRWTSSAIPNRELLGSLDYTFAAQHMTFREMTDYGFVSEERCPGYRSFAVIRNPFDRAVSSVFHHFAADLQSGTRRIDDPASFTRALRDWLDNMPRDHNQVAHKRSQSDFLSLDGRSIGVDELIRYEDLGEEIAAFCDRNGLPPVEIGWSGRNKRSRDYRDYFSPEAREVLKNRYENDLDLLGYAF